MNALLDAVGTSILAEVTGANTWTIEKKGPMWRNPKKGKVLNIYLGRETPSTPRWTGGSVDLTEVVVEYMEPAPEQSRKLSHDQTGEYAANDVALSLREWALSHPEGFAPAHRMDWLSTEYTDQVNRELFVRYCRVTFGFEMVREFV